MAVEHFAGFAFVIVMAVFGIAFTIFAFNIMYEWLIRIIKQKYGGY